MMSLLGLLSAENEIPPAEPLISCLTTALSCLTTVLTDSPISHCILILIENLLKKSDDLLA